MLQGTMAGKFALTIYFILRSGTHSAPQRSMLIDSMSLNQSATLCATLCTGIIYEHFLYKNACVY